jgi:hypothetical protein
MKAFAQALLAALALTATAFAQGRKDDLPDVSLQIPQETRPELKATLTSQALALGSKNWKDRVTALSVLAELGEQGAPARGIVCRSMMDIHPTVRVAAADALQRIDPKIHHLAVTLAADRAAASSVIRREQVLRSIRDLRDDGWPLAPLVAAETRALIAVATDRNPSQAALLATNLEALGAIARNDLAAAKIVAAGLNSQAQPGRHAALLALRGMKHGKLAVTRIIALSRTDTDGNRVAAIGTLAALADGSNEEVIAAAINAQRYHPAEPVRRAVALALNKLQLKGGDTGSEPKPEPKSRSKSRPKRK